MLCVDYQKLWVEYQISVEDQSRIRDPGLDSLSFLTSSQSIFISLRTRPGLI